MTTAAAHDTPGARRSAGAVRDALDELDLHYSTAIHQALVVADHERAAQLASAYDRAAARLAAERAA